ncbi:MAG TPA: DNA methyltransferase [Anaerolineales bacterium]|nr:DNA methyltransferase [Anaerolineales bacterium]
MPPKRPFRNRLNDLSPKEWLRFQKSWFVHNPPPRQRQARRHPAKFPETLAQEFVEFFTKRGQRVLDPMVGTGSTLVACLRSGRNSVGIELNPTYARLAQQTVAEEREQLGEQAAELEAEVITADAAQLPDLGLPAADYVLTSPPYWNMLHVRGAETQLRRRLQDGLDVVYSDHPADLGNIADYGEFLDRLVAVYAALPAVLRPKAYLTIIVKNVKKGGQVFPLAWDLAARLSRMFTLKDEKIWAQDDIRLAPYGLGNAWVSNTFHHYCLQFRYEP